MRHVQDNAEEQVRRAIDRLKDGELRLRDGRWRGDRVRIAIDAQARRRAIDFTGTSAQRATNFNAPPAVCKAAVLYVFRTLVDDDIPLNDGCLKPLDIIIPEGSMLNPRYPAAVVAGNVETSQVHHRRALRRARRAGRGAGHDEQFHLRQRALPILRDHLRRLGRGAGFRRRDAVQTHMTNTRLTDPEVLEWRFPVLVEDFAIRRGSGGQGRWRGGDGVGPPRSASASR